MCGDTNIMTLDKKEENGVERYISGGILLQNAVPGLNPMEREFFKTGYCPECQNMIFGTRFKSRKIKARLEPERIFS